MLQNANAYLCYFADPYTCRCRRGWGLWAGGGFVNGSHIRVKCKYTFKVNLYRETYEEKKNECKQTSVYFLLMLSCLGREQPPMSWTIMNGCSISASQSVKTEIKWQVESADNELHLLPVYLFSFCVSIFYPFYCDTLIFIVHRCHHCLMNTTCNGSKRVHESHRNIKNKIKSNTRMRNS